MKTLLAILTLLTLVSGPLPAAPPPEATPAPPTPPPKTWWSDVVLTPFGAVSHTDFQGKPTWGAGLDLGYYINNTVSLHVSSMGTEENDWRGSAIDETSFLFKADLIRDSRERFVGSLLASVDRYWSDHHDDIDDGHKEKGSDGGWGVGVGAGGEIRLSKNFSFGVDYRVRFRENEDIGSLGRGFFRIRF